MTEAIIGAVLGALVAAFATWLFRRATAIETFYLEASGATRALEKVVDGTGDIGMAEHLAGVVSPLGDALGLRVRRLERPARTWADALTAKNLDKARAAQTAFARKARFAGFGF